MNRILHIILISIFCLTVVSCAKKDSSSSTATTDTSSTTDNTSSSSSDPKKITGTLGVRSEMGGAHRPRLYHT